MKSGIYIWKNIINNKVYIGATSNFKKRKNEHIRKSINGSHYEVHKAIKDIGIDNFLFEILEYVEESKLGEREKFWIKKYDSINNGYNTLDGYNSISSNPNLEIIKKNIGNKASKRKWIKKNGIQKSVYLDDLEYYLAEGWEFGRIPFSQDHIKQISKSVTGFKHTDEAKEKCKTFLGRSHSEKTRNEMSSKLMGRYSLKWYIEKYGKKQGTEKYNLHQKNNSKSKLGRIWINKNGKTKQIDKIHYGKFISDGWNKGRK
jgi:hypothetical protein